MITIVECNQCGSQEVGSLRFVFTNWIHGCEHCYRTDYHKTDYSFCNLDCFSAWLKENQILEEGFHCVDCLDYMDDGPNYKSTGFLGGIESNGICTTCNGTKRVKTPNRTTR